VYEECLDKEPQHCKKDRVELRVNMYKERYTNELALFYAAVCPTVTDDMKNPMLKETRLRDIVDVSSQAYIDTAQGIVAAYESQYASARTSGSTSDSASSSHSVIADVDAAAAAADASDIGSRLDDRLAEAVTVLKETWAYERHIAD
jgi:hypothetical protein